MSDRSERFTIWHGLFRGESAAVLSGLAKTIVPSKIGSREGLAGHVFPEPTFLTEFKFKSESTTCC